jgi:hypothetical protein
MIGRLTWTLAFLLLTVAPAAAQRTPDRNCTDDNGVDRCDAEQQRRTRALFGVRSIEEHRDAGDQIRRVFYVDGYGRDMVLISFIRAPGREPMANVHFPRREGERPRQPFEAPVPHAVWDDVLWRSARFERSFATQPPPPQPGEGQIVTMCIHSWVYTIEANDPRRRSEPASLRRKTEDACEDGPGEMFAIELQRAALPLFPACAALDPEQHRNPASQLAACAILSGDRLAAAEVMNLLDRFRRARRPEDSEMLAGIFDFGARFDWQGTQYVSRDAHPENFWLERMAADRAQGLYYDSIEGLSADRVRVRGSLHRSVDLPNAGGTTHYRAPVEMIWVSTSVREFQVESVTVGSWQVQRPR